jgi:hypothetical protein
MYSRDQTPTQNSTRPLVYLVTPSILANPQSTTVHGVLSIPVPSVGIMARTTMRYDTFDGSSHTDPKMFLREFEAKAKSNNQGTDDLKASIFGGLMIKSAQTLYDQHPTKDDWLCVKKAFFTKYQEEVSSRAFIKIKHLKMKRHGSIQKYAHKLLELVNKYEPSTSADTIRDWFITGLPPDINRFVRIQRSKVRTMEEALEAVSNLCGF